MNWSDGNCIKKWLQNNESPTVSVGGFLYIEGQVRDEIKKAHFESELLFCIVKPRHSGVVR